MSKEDFPTYKHTPLPEAELHASIILKDLSFSTSTKFMQHHQLHLTAETQQHPQPSVQSYPELSGNGNAPWGFSAKSMSSGKAELT